MQQKWVKKPKDRSANMGRSYLMNDNRSGLNNNVLPMKAYRDPFRISDERLLIGKYKGCKLDQVKPQYLMWLHDNVNMSSTHKSILKDKYANL